MYKIITKAVRVLSILVIGLTVLSGFPVSALAASSFNSLTVGSQTGSLTAGSAGSGTYLITVNRSGSGSLNVVLSVTTALPSGVTASFNPSTVSFTGGTPTSATSTLTLTTTNAAAATTTSFTVSGTGNSTTQTANGTLTIGPAASTTGSLTVIKNVINNDSGTAVASDFTMNVTGTNVSSPSFPGNATGTTVTLDPGSYSVSESGGPTGYASSSSSDCSGSIAAGESKTCTITNDDQPVATTTATTTGSITVNKVVLDPTGATTTDHTSFTVSLNGTSTTSVGDNSPAVFTGLALDTTYSLSEDAHVGYNPVSISPSATTTLTAGATSTTITIINQQQATTTPAYAVTINTPSITDMTVDLTGTASTSGSVGNASQYDVQVDWGDAVTTDTSPHSFTPPVGDFSGTWGTDSHTYASPGTYTVTAKLYHGSLSGNEGDATSTVQVTVPATSTKGVLVIVKNVVDANDEDVSDDTSFNVSVDGTSTTAVSEGSNAVFLLEPGEHIVSEANHEGYTLESISPSATTTISTGATTTVTITNKQIIPPTTATVHVHKVTIPGNFDVDFTYSLKQGATTTATTTANAQKGDGTINNIAPGIYDLIEEDTPLWAFSSVNCTYEGSSTGSVIVHGESLILAAGDVVDCTFTNIASGGGIKVIKQILASDGTTAATADDTTFTIHINGFSADVISQFSPVEHTGVEPGSYTVSEDATSSHDLFSISPDSDSDTSGGQFTVQNGTTTVVTIVNIQHASSTATINIQKVTNPNNSDHDFTFTLDDNDDNIATTTVNASGTARQIANLAPGAYNLKEIQEAPWSLGGISCQYEGTSTGNSIFSGEQLIGEHITLDAGDVVDCTFTNNSSDGEIRVIKNVIDSNSADISDTHSFSVTLNGTSTKTVAEGSNALYTNLEPGTYTIGENADSGYDLVSITSSSTVTVSAGTTTVVTITNRKHAVPAGSGTSGGGGSSFGATGYATPPFTTGGGTGGGIGQVLGASIDTGASCNSDKLLKSYLRRGRSNNRAEVTKLQLFLNTQNLGITLPVTGFFGPLTERAVNLFQLKYANDILGPWVNAGRHPSLSVPTGYVYKTTLRWINHLICLSLAVPPVQL